MLGVEAVWAQPDKPQVCPCGAGRRDPPGGSQEAAGGGQAASERRLSPEVSREPLESFNQEPYRTEFAL